MKYKLKKVFTKNPENALIEILEDRGVTDINNFIHPTKQCELSPYNLENIKQAADKLLYHLRNHNSNILFIVDCDVDGVSSAAILWLYIKNIFPQANLNFTMHEHKQHGLDDKIDWIEQQNFDLIIVPDAGSYNIEEHKRLNELGIDCIILDHHDQLYDENGNPILSNFSNTIIVNNQLSSNYTNKSLCGAGVVYKFCEVLDDIVGIKQAQEYLDLAALGEIADVMDRTDIETNYIMLEGLAYINNKGFQTLIESQSYSLKEKSTWPYMGLTPIDVAFYIAPLINAIIRVGTMEEKETLFYCFINPDKLVQSTKRGAKANDFETAAEQTARVGKNAKARQDKMKEKALDLIDFKIQKNNLDENNIIIVEIEPEDNIPQEITGLIAMAVVNKYNKPVMIGRSNDRDELQGSIRNNSNFAGLPSFKQFLENSGLMLYVAGHDNAAGWGLAGKNYDKLIQYGNTHLNADTFENCYSVDYILDAREDNKELLFKLAEHPEYFGNHIDEIKIVIEHISLQNIQTMGPNKDSVKINFNGIDYVKFKDLDFIDDILNNRLKELIIYGRININEWQGRKSIQVFIDDYELKSNESRYDF